MAKTIIAHVLNLALFLAKFQVLFLKTMDLCIILQKIGAYCIKKRYYCDIETRFCVG
jgi:hypothetical protein